MALKMLVSLIPTSIWKVRQSVLGTLTAFSMHHLWFLLLSVWPDSAVCGRVHPWQFGEQTHQSPPTPTPHCLVALKPLTFIQLTFHSSHSVGGGKQSPFLSIDLRATIIVLWNETATAQLRQEAAHSVFLLFTICGILLLLFMLQMFLITNFFAKTLNLQLWMMCMVFHCVWLVKSVFDLLK